MDNSQQKQFIASLRRPQLNQLCLEMQAMLSNFQMFLAETHGYTEEEIHRIQRGTKFEDLETTVDPSTQPTRTAAEPTTKAKSFVQPNPQDLAAAKKEDEMIRRSLAFELQWCVANIEKGLRP